MRDREDQRQEERHRRPDVGDEPHHRRQATPEHRVRHADRPEAQADDQPVPRVDQRDHRQVAADPLADLAHGPGREVDLALAEELDDPVSQVLPVHEHEQDQDEHETTDAEELQVGADGRLEALPERGLLDDPHVHRLVPRDDRRVERLGHVAGDFLCPIERRVVRRLQEVHLLLDSLLIARQLVGQHGELPHDDVADPAQRPEREGDREEDRDGPRHPTPLEESRKRRQCEAEEHRQGQRLQHLGRERHRGDDRQDEEGHDGRMVHRGLALSGHGGVPVRVTWISQVGEEAGILLALPGDARPADRS